MLYIFASWLYYDTDVSTEVLREETLCSQECEEFGQKFVKKYLKSSKGTTLLHYALTNFVILEDEEDIYDKYPNLSQLIEALLHWGAYKVIDVPDNSGMRPIHIAVNRANENQDTEVQELVSPLIACGAHLDAVNRHGETAVEQCTNEVVKVVLYSSGPLPLTCQASNCVVREGLPYRSIGLPTHVVNLIKLHDMLSINHTCS